ncbi:MAG TPA: hypothetical protein VF490_13305 [Chryseosolibacter sp.]
MKRKKAAVLISALILPVAIFLFLKIFGRNEFQVAPLHQQGTLPAPANCPYLYETPYRVADSVIAELRLGKTDSLFVLYFDPALATPLKRVSVEYGDAPVKLVPPSSLPPDVDRRVLQECILLLHPPASVVMLDHLKRIRGYYDGRDRDEVDRLLVEIDIILKHY